MNLSSARPRRCPRPSGRAAVRAAASLAILGCASAPPQPVPPTTLTEHASGTTALLQAISIVDANVAWASGHGGTYALTTDGGATWTAAVVPGADTLEFRDVHALDARTAWLLAAGAGDLSRIYHTADGGATWTPQWTNPEPDGFYDCVAFWDTRRGIVYGDAVDGALRILRTDDGGLTWALVPESALPAALPAEGGFAASGSCVETGDDGRAWIAAGNASRARVFMTGDYGRSWTAADVPVASGEGAGLTSIAMVDARTGYAFGGDLGVRDRRTQNVARTSDGGRTWNALPPISFAGAIYGGAVIPGTDGRALVVVGPGGVAVSADAGATWQTVDGRSWWSVASHGAGATWVAGPDGRIARLR